MVDQRINAVFAGAVKALSEGRPVLEIGAGTGSLTSHLLTISPLVHAIERDRDLVPILREHFAEELSKGHLVLHEADGARFDIAAVFSTNNQGVLVGNLPYHLTSSIILLALSHRALLCGAVFLVQKEVADRLVAEPNNKHYGFLTVILKLAFTVKKIANVDKSAFWPAPKIDSAIIQLTTADHGINLVENTQNLIVFVREIFQKRRKKLSTILSGTIDRDSLTDLGIDPNLRPENLSPDQFLKLYLTCQ
jgi:16S rRNA (adenine1518-N6/adenine1519-N6)-dimethyltransferase